MRGRWPSSIEELIDAIDGPDETKERLKMIFATGHGDARVVDACATLGLGETRFEQLRKLAVHGAFHAISPRPAGRPCRTAPVEAELVRELRQRIAELEQALHESQVREEIALVFPNLRRTAGSSDDVAEEKKMPQEPVKVRKPR